MSSANSEQVFNHDSLLADRGKKRSPSYGNDPKVLADIYQEVREAHAVFWKCRATPLLVSSTDGSWTSRAHSLQDEHVPAPDVDTVRVLQKWGDRLYGSGCM